MFINRVSSYVYLPLFMPRHNVAPRLPCATRAAQVKEKVTLELKEVILEQLEGAYDEAQSSVRGVVKQNLLPIGCAVVSCVMLPLAALGVVTVKVMRM